MDIASKSYIVLRHEEKMVILFTREKTELASSLQFQTLIDREKVV